jgi:hypothetical protein
MEEGDVVITRLALSVYRACACDVAFHCSKAGLVELAGSVLLLCCVDESLGSDSTLCVHEWARLCVGDVTPIRAKFFPGCSIKMARAVRGVVVTVALLENVVPAAVVLRCAVRQLRFYMHCLRPGHVVGLMVAGVVCRVKVVAVSKSDADFQVVEQSPQMLPFSSLELALELCFGQQVLPRLLSMRSGLQSKLVLVTGRGMRLELLLSVLARRLGMSFMAVDAESASWASLPSGAVLCIQGLDHPDADTSDLRRWLEGCFSPDRRQVPVLLCSSLGLLAPDLRSACIAIQIKSPNAEQRRSILAALNGQADDLDETVENTGGFSVSDLERLHAVAAGCGWVEARKRVRPMLLSEMNSDFGLDVSWSQVVGCGNVRRALERAILWPLRHPELMEQFGLKYSGGILVYGPSGCGKSLSVAAFASACKINLVQVSAGQLTSKYTGETEAQIRGVFASCRAVAPCVLALDDFDQLAASRDAEELEDTGGALQRSVSTLLNELDGLDTGGEGIFFVALSNRPWLLDSAILRPGRIDSMV